MKYTTKLYMYIYIYGMLRHFCENPVCLDPVWKLSRLIGLMFCRYMRPMQTLSDMSR